MFTLKLLRAAQSYLSSSIYLTDFSWLNSRSRNFLEAKICYNIANILAQFSYTFTLILRPEAYFDPTTSTQALTTKNRAQTTRNAHPKAQKNNCRICSTKPAIHEQAEPFSYTFTLILRPEAYFDPTTSTQALTTKNRAQTTRNAHPKAQKNNCRICSTKPAIHEQAEPTGFLNSLLLASKLVSMGRASLKESSATKNVKHKGWNRQEMAIEKDGEQ
ncbi:hypothetical protein F511_42702 [Dorcoceras hygrometricum]|uniref:Uncharacterized protein n=1 Tax=Dorcoceras hygrometricum TaxID=472368 RepID=A0A2Z7CP87_9LAMI|nr:hypothetical protein F511_42702 [Dorcoceras hygrometricum]